MSDDIEGVLRRAAATPRQDLSMAKVRSKAGRSQMMRAVVVGAGATVLTLASLGLVTSFNDGERSHPPAGPSETPEPSETTPSSPSATPSPSPTPDEEEPRDPELVWPEPFVPTTTRSGERELMPVIFPDKTVATFSYPAELRLADRGVQVTLSYSFKEGRPNAPHDIIFIPGEPPQGLLDPKPVEMFGTTPYSSAVHQITYDLRGDPPYALVYEADGWTIVATLPRREDADIVAQNLHPSVTDDGWPTVFATGPIELSEFFGEARGPHLEINDKNPIFDIADTGEVFEYIVIGPTGCSPGRDTIHESGGNWYGSKCLVFAGGEPRIVVSIYGPENFVRAIYNGIALEEP